MPSYDEIIQQQLALLKKAAGNAGEHKEALENEITALETQYKAANEKQKKALAGSLPGIAKGTSAAVTAFQQQPPDAIGGSAAVMDILSGVSALLGPEGAVLEALFSMVSMILGFFAPKPPSLLTQIETLMRDLDAERQNSEIKTAGDTVTVYANTCDKYMQDIQNETDDTKRSGLIGQLTDEVVQLQLLDGGTINKIRFTQHWLETEGNQELDGWPEVLNLHCEVYMHLRLALTQQSFFANDKIVAKWPGVAELQTRLREKFRNLAQNDLLTSVFLEEIMPIARKRGLYVTSWRDDQILVATGPKAFEENKLVKIREHCHWMSITPPKGGVNDPATPYDLWVWDWSTERSYNQSLNVKFRKLAPDGYEIEVWKLGNGYVLWSDWCVVPTSGADNTFTIYCAAIADSMGPCGIRKYGWTKGYRGLAGGQLVTTSQVLSKVRVVTPSATLPDDPDKDEMPENLLKGDNIIYATLDNSRDIFVYVNGSQYTVPIPMDDYSGISVDPYFLWMYGPHGFACATHASVMSCINKKRATPRWLGNGQKKNIANVFDLSSCEDGTLFVAAGIELSTSVYHVEFNKASVGEGEWLVIDKWETVKGGGGVQCQKLPIFGWKRIEALAAALSPKPA